MRRQRIVRPRLILGIFLTLLGVGLTLDRLDLLPGSELRSYWPLLLVAVGIARMLGGQWLRGLVVLALGVVFLLPGLSDSITWQDLFEQWPLFLVALGVFTVLKGLGIGGERNADDVVSTPRIDAFGFFTTARHRLDTQTFRGGDLGALLGGCEIDLRDAELAPEGAVLDVFAVWGGINIKVPRHWQVELRTLPIMGGAEDKTRQLAGASGPRLVLRGLVMMAGVEIGN